MFTDDLSVFFNDKELAVIATRTLTTGEIETANVIYDHPDAMFVGEMVQSTQAEITYAVTAFIGLQHGEQLMIEGRALKVVSTPRATDDGTLMKAELKRVEP